MKHTLAVVMVLTIGCGSSESGSTSTETADTASTSDTASAPDTTSTSDTAASDTDLVTSDGTATDTGTLPGVPDAAVSSGIWISKGEVAALAMTGAAWDNVKKAANGSWGTPDLSNNDSDHDVFVLAGALVAVRTGDAAMMTKVVNALDAVRSSPFARVLELSRNIQSYVFAADLIELDKVDVAKGAAFRTFLATLPTKKLDGHSGGVDLKSTAKLSPNNWGNHARAATAAIALYLGDTTTRDEVAAWHKGWIGDRAAYAGFNNWDAALWHCDPTKPVGINPKGCKREGHDFDGLLPEDQRRAGAYSWPAAKESYTWEALQGAVVTAAILARAGLVAPTASDSAILRAVQWHYRNNFVGGGTYPAEGDDTWIPWVINKMYGTTIPALPSSSGKNMGFTDWTHS